MLACEHAVLCTGISAAEALPAQKAAAGKKQKTLGSDSDELDSESDDDPDQIMEDIDSDSAVEEGSDLSQEMLEDRQSGLPAEISGRPAITPGQYLAFP